MAKTRHEEVEDLLPQKRRNPNINTEVNSILATAASKEELNSPASDLLQMTASKAPRTLSPTAKPRSDELVGSQFPQAAMPGDPNPRDATSSHADLPEQASSQVIQEQTSASLQCHLFTNDTITAASSSNTIFKEHSSSCSNQADRDIIPNPPLFSSPRYPVQNYMEPDQESQVDINRRWRIFLTAHKAQMTLFSEADSEEDELRIINRYYWLPHHREIYMLYCHLNATKNSHTDIHAKRITLQAIDNVSKPAFQDIRPSEDEYLYALTHHLSHTATATKFTTIMDARQIHNSFIDPRPWDTFQRVSTNAGSIKMTLWILQWFKLRLTYQEHILCNIDRAVFGSYHKRERFLTLHPLFFSS